MRNEFTYNSTELKETDAIILNGGYFEDPFYRGERIKLENSDEYIWAYQGNPNDTRPFNYLKSILIDDYYNWSGLKITLQSFYYSDHTNNSINCGEFGSHAKV